MQTPNKYVGHFRNASTEWAVSEADDPQLVAAAWVQFRIAREVWKLIADRVLSVERIATALSQSVEAQRKKLSGTQPASLRDLVVWIMFAGPPALDALPRSDEELFPESALKLLGGWQSGQDGPPRFSSAPLWGRLASGLLADLTVAEARSHGHLVDSTWLLHAAVARIDQAGIQPQRMRLRQLGGQIGLQLGISDAVAVGLQLVGEEEAASVSGALVAQARLRGCVRALADTGAAAVLVVAAVGEVGTGVLDELLPIKDVASQCTLGPLEPVGKEHLEEWWAHHAVDLEVVALQSAPQGPAVVALQIVKTHQM